MDTERWLLRGLADHGTLVVKDAYVAHFGRWKGKSLKGKSLANEVKGLTRTNPRYPWMRVHALSMILH